MSVESASGFTIIEALIALLILGFGLLWAGQMIFVAMSAASLARSKGSAALVAQSQLDSLGDLYRSNPEAPEMSEGSHTGDQVQLSTGGTVLNRYAVSWDVGPVPDPRGGVIPRTRLVRVTVVPVGDDGTVNVKVRLNAVVSVSSVFCTGVR